MKIVITGGAGFVGSHLTERLLDQGHAVVVIDDFSTGRAENLAHLSTDRLTVREMGIESLDADGVWADGVDRVFHLAAAVGVKLIVDRPVESIETNIMGTALLLRAVADRGIPTLITSSSEVYGKSSRVPFREDDDVTYGATIYSRWSYAMSKAMDEYLALAHHHTDGLPVVVARLFNTVGPRQIGQYGMVIPRFIERALRDEPIEVYGDGGQTRSFCHVRDAVEALDRLLNDERCHGQVFNVGATEEVSIEQLAQRVIKKTGSAGGITPVPYERAYGRGFDDLRRRVPDLTKIRCAIGFEPKTDLDAILDELIEPDRPQGGAASEASHA